MTSHRKLSMALPQIICVGKRGMTGIAWWRHRVNHFPSYWPFVRGIHRSPVISPHKGQWGGALMFSLICTRINGWVNTGEAGDLRCHRAHYDVIAMEPEYCVDVFTMTAINRLHIDMKKTLALCNSLRYMCRKTRWQWYTKAHLILQCSFKCSTTYYSAISFQHLWNSTLSRFMAPLAL